jgi:hypothetical protein
MAAFIDLKKSKHNREASLSSIQLIKGDELIIGLRDQEPKDWSIVQLIPDIADLIELVPDNRRGWLRQFRLTARTTGVGVLTARQSFVPLAAVVVTVQDTAIPKPSHQDADLIYDGQQLSWPARKRTYRATSGVVATGPVPDRSTQDVVYSCSKDYGPVPEGHYTLSTKLDPKEYAALDKKKECTLAPGAGIQKIPRGERAGECEKYFVNWGAHRVRLQPADHRTVHACATKRDGFYLHDSTKGFSHGCVELNGDFFTDLYHYAKHSHGRRLTLLVKYAHQTTNGGTRVDSLIAPR